MAEQDDNVSGNDWSPERSIPVDQLAHQFAMNGFCRIPDVISTDDIRTFKRCALDHEYLAYRSIEKVNPFLETPDQIEALATPDPVRSTLDSFLLRVVACDQLRDDTLFKRFYYTHSLLKFVRALTGQKNLKRFSDKLGAINLTFMAAGDQIPWHFDHSGYVLSLPLTSPTTGGEFEIVIKSERSRSEVAQRVLAGDRRKIMRFAVEPGTAILFSGRQCLHRVRRVEGDEPRIVVLFGYDPDPKTHATAEANFGRYGRAS